MIELILRDDLPRAIAYPVHDTFFEEVLSDDVQVRDIGLYLLYTSAAQANHYDPLVSAAACYPVLALDNEAPPLCGNVVTQLFEAKHSKRNAPVVGSARAEMQLRGRLEYGPECEIDSLSGQRKIEAMVRAIELPPISISVFPVKRRLRTRILDAIQDHGLRPLANWLSASPEQKLFQRPLVLVYDESSGTITSKFADAEALAQRSRVYR